MARTVAIVSKRDQERYGFTPLDMSDSRSSSVDEKPSEEVAMELIADFCYGLPVSGKRHVRDVCVYIYIAIPSLNQLVR